MQCYVMQEGVDYDGIGAEDDASFPTELSEGTSEINPTMLTSVESASELFEENLQSPTGCLFKDFMLFKLV